MDDKDLYSSLIRLHVLSHACQELIFGAGIIEELARHEYRLGPTEMGRFNLLPKVVDRNGPFQ
jgi:hypothetical protein